MPPKKKKIEAKKTTVSLYNQIQKEFRVINDKLPINFQLSLALRRKLISDNIYPAFKNRKKRNK